MSSAMVTIGSGPESLFTEGRPKRDMLLPTDRAIPTAQILDCFLENSALASDLNASRETQVRDSVVILADNLVLVYVMPCPHIHPGETVRHRPSSGFVI